MRHQKSLHPQVVAARRKSLKGIRKRIKASPKQRVLSPFQTFTRALLLVDEFSRRDLENSIDSSGTRLGRWGHVLGDILHHCLELSSALCVTPLCSQRIPDCPKVLEEPSTAYCEGRHGDDAIVFGLFRVQAWCSSVCYVRRGNFELAMWSDCSAQPLFAWACAMVEWELLSPGSLI